MSQAFEAEIDGARVTLWHRKTPWLRYMVELRQKGESWHYWLHGDRASVSVEFASKQDAFEQIVDDYQVIMSSLESSGFHDLTAGIP